MKQFGILRRPRSLVWRTLLLFLFSQIILFIPSILAVRWYWQRWQYEVDQRLSTGVAIDFAHSIQRYLDPSINLIEVRNQAHRFSLNNPRFGLFLLDQNGKILEDLSFTEDRPFQDSVSIAPIMRLISEGSRAEFPIFAEDPHRLARTTIFSAAPVRIEGQPGFIYVTLVSTKSDRYEQIFTASSTLSALFILFPVLLLWCVPMGFICVYLYTRPLLNIADGIRAYESGDIETRLSPKSSDELREISLAFNRMADSLARQFAHLEEKDRLRRELIADVSHDLHASVAGISAVAEHLRTSSQPLAPREQSELVKVIDDRTQSFRALLSELFQLSRLEGGETPINLKRTSIPLLLEDLNLTFRLQSQARGIHIEVDYPENCPLASADSALISRAITNLLNNALRYTPDGGKIRLACFPIEGRLAVEVADSGVGIHAEDLPKLFNRSFQSSGQPTGQKGLGGLGLAIVRKIIELHGSSIEVQSEPLQGTRFSFSLAIDGSNEK